MASEKIRCSNCNRLVRYRVKDLKGSDVTCQVCKKETPVEAKAVVRFVRTTPRKLRLVADAIRGKSVKDALVLLRFTPKRAARVLSRVVESAKANAENTYQMDPENLMISKIYVDGGPTWKRFMPRAQGRASPIHKRTSHITVKVREAAEAVEKKEAKARPARKPRTAKGQKVQAAEKAPKVAAKKSGEKQARAKRVEKSKKDQGEAHSHGTEG